MKKPLRTSTVKERHVSCLQRTAAAYLNWKLKQFYSIIMLRMLFHSQIIASFQLDFSWHYFSVFSVPTILSKKTTHPSSEEKNEDIRPCTAAVTFTPSFTPELTSPLHSLIRPHRLSSVHHFDTLCLWSRLSCVTVRFCRTQFSPDWRYQNNKPQTSHSRQVVALTKGI